MGFNVSGLAVNKNFKNNFNELQEKLGWYLEEDSEITFEEASSNYKDENICDVYFSEKGTLLLVSIDKCNRSYPIENLDSLSFALSETAMAFSLNYCKNGRLKREIMEVNGERFTNEGEALKVEEKSTDASVTIWNQMGVVLGKEFWDIGQDEKAMRYKFISKGEYDKKNVKQTEKEEDLRREVRNEMKPVKLDNIKSKEKLTDKPKKNWWEFWK